MGVACWLLGLPKTLPCILIKFDYKNRCNTQWVLNYSIGKINKLQWFTLIENGTKHSNRAVIFMLWDWILTAYTQMHVQIHAYTYTRPYLPSKMICSWSDFCLVLLYFNIQFKCWQCPSNIHNYNLTLLRWRSSVRPRNNLDLSFQCS